MLTKRKMAAEERAAEERATKAEERLKRKIQRQEIEISEK